MANVFISHSSADIDWAEQIRQWLCEDGHKVFLDSHQDDGIAAGDEWRARLCERLRWADAVICVVTPPYLTSPWCAAEIGAAQALGSEILPVRAASEPLDDRLLTTKQYVDVVRDASDARDRLRLRLSIIDGSRGRGWLDSTYNLDGLRWHNLTNEQDNFREICHRIARKIEMSGNKENGPKWLMVLVNKADLYWGRTDQVLNYYVPGSGSPFDVHRQGLCDPIGLNTVQYVLTPLITNLSNYRFQPSSTAIQAPSHAALNQGNVNALS